MPIIIALLVLFVTACSNIVVADLGEPADDRDSAQGDRDQAPSDGGDSGGDDGSDLPVVGDTDAPQAHGEVPRVIFDSDMSSDWDDAGDIGVLHGFATLGEIEIIGMMASSQNGATPLCMDAINTWYGHPDIPIGRRPDVQGNGGYPAQIATEYPHGPETTATDFPLATSLYRQLLAGSPDRSVVIVTAGYVNNVQALLQSGPDEYSALSGVDLVRQKVKLFACVGGQYPSGDEFNFRVEPAAASYVVNNYPSAVTYTGFELGNQIRTAGRLPDAEADSPIRRIYVDIEDNYPYPSWTQIGMYQAFRSGDGLFGVFDTGRNNADSSAHNYWTETPDPSGDDNQAYLLERVRMPVIDALDALMNLAPLSRTETKPGWPSNLRATVVGDHIDLVWTDNAFNEDEFVLERRDVNGSYGVIARIAANNTTYSDTAVSAIANQSYRVKARNAVGDSLYATVWIYSGWTEINFGAGGTSPALYSHYQHNLHWARGGDFRPDHVALNDDSTHGSQLTIDVDVSTEGDQGTFFVYFFYTDANNWYRLRVDETTCAFEKRVAGTMSTIGAPGVHSNVARGTGPSHWHITVAPSGRLTFTRTMPFTAAPELAYHVVGTLLDVTEAPVFTVGKIGLGGSARTPIWENFDFRTGD